VNGSSHSDELSRRKLRCDVSGEGNSDRRMVWQTYDDKNCYVQMILFLSYEACGAMLVARMAGTEFVCPCGRDGNTGRWATKVPFMLPSLAAHREAKGRPFESLSPKEMKATWLHVPSWCDSPKGWEIQRTAICVL
jgi:hypothetical protein